MLTQRELKTLDKRIGQNADRLIKKQQSVLVTAYNGRGRKPSSFVNKIQPEITEVLHHSEEGWPLWVDDIVSGIARLDWHRPSERSIPLSGKSMLTILSALAIVDVFGISNLLLIGERQSQKYYRACELAHSKLEDSFCLYEDIHYPPTFIYIYEPTSDTDIKEY
jgi:hypothetical protein